MNIHTPQQIKVLFRKYAFGKLSTEEFRELKEEVSQKNDQELMPFLQEEWEELKGYPPLSATEKEALFFEIRQQTKPRIRLNWQRKGLQIAASLAIVLLTGLSVYLYTSNRQMIELGERNVVVKVGKGERVSVTLPDGTSVRLNSESVLSYQQDFGLKDRNVFLAGEGFFDVVKSEGRKFIVNTRFLDIQVLGTSFNVYTYENADSVEMSLVRGKVQVTTVSPPYQTFNVSPNEKVVYNKATGKMRVESSSNLIETAWISNELVFRSTPLKEVFNRVGRKYGVLFKVEDDTLLNDLYTGVFDEPEIADVMLILEANFGFNYRIQEDTVWIRRTKK